MDITETDDNYVVSFFPNAEEVEIDDQPDKGWKAIIGIQDGLHVVMKTLYNKSIFPYDEEDKIERFGADYDKQTVKALAGNIRNCPICKRLDADVAKIRNVKLYDRSPAPVTQPMPIVPVATTSNAFNTGNPLGDMLVRLKFDTLLNPTGKALAALALDDDALAKSVMPTDVKGMLDLVANLTEYAQGKGSLYRTPEEVTEFVKALREGNKSDDDKANDKKPGKVFTQRARTVIIS